MFHLLLAVIYLSFISLGLPDSLLGSAWPSMYPEFGVPVSSASIIFMIISAGTIVSSLLSDRLTRCLGTGKVTSFSVGLTALALFGFSLSHSFWLLCLFAVPYGLGAGSVDAALNNYVALHYKSRHMSWLHCMWGVGASLGPCIMGLALSDGHPWNTGYLCISLLQAALTAVLLVSLPLWGKKQTAADNDASQGQPLSFREVIRIPGAREIMVTFFCYCALEQTAGLWGSSFLVLHRGVSPEDAARFASLFFLGITAGRAAGGFLTMLLSDTNLVRLGQGIILVGILALFLPAGGFFSMAGLLLIGLGCAPVYPSIIHSTPERFGAENSQTVIGIQMASAYVGNCLMPPLFGLIAEHLDIGLFIPYLLLILAAMFLMHEKTVRKCRMACMERICVSQ